MTDARPSTRPATTAAIPERLRRPVHFGVLLGLSTGLYATTLAGVAVLQQRADDDLSAARAPAVARTERLRDGNDRLAAVVDALGTRERGAATTYGALRDRMRAIEAALDDLAVTVTDVSGAAAALPRRIALPAVPSQRSISVASGGRPPRTHATSGASGGG